MINDLKDGLVETKLKEESSDHNQIWGFDDRNET